MNFIRLFYKNPEVKEETISIDVYNTTFDETGTFMAYTVNQDGTTALVISKNKVGNYSFELGILQETWEQIKDIPAEDIVCLEFYQDENKVYTLNDSILKIEYVLNFLTYVECINIICKQKKREKEEGTIEWLMQETA